MDNTDLKNIDVKKMIRGVVEGDRYQWILAGLGEENIKLIEERLVARFSKIIPGLAKLQETIKNDPKMARLVDNKLDEILKSDDSAL